MQVQTSNQSGGLPSRGAQWRNWAERRARHAAKDGAYRPVELAFFHEPVRIS